MKNAPPRTSALRPEKTRRALVGWSLLPCVILSGALCFVGWAAWGANAEGRLNLADKKELPGGPGLAAAFPGDSGLEASAEVIFADNFESGNLGEGWDETRNENGQVLGWEDPGRARA